MTSIAVTHFTDPGCPWAFSAEPRRLQLLWHYGDQLEFDTRMIVLTRSPEDYERLGLTVEFIQNAFLDIQRTYGMPISGERRSRMHATEPACRAYVAARLHDEARADVLLRRLRVRTMRGELLDEQSTIDGAAQEAGIETAELHTWCGDVRVEQRLHEDFELAREPSPTARALDHKLSTALDGRRRYSAPSLEFRVDCTTTSAPGFQPFESYEVALANLGVPLQRSAAPKTAAEVLEWALFPLATAEVAALRGIGLAQARTELESVARFDPTGLDGYWSLRG